jgi:site-specific recombinase XerD
MTNDTTLTTKTSPTLAAWPTVAPEQSERRPAAVYAELIARDVLPADRHPAAVYLAGLAPGSRRTMRAALDTLADMLIKDADALGVEWAALRFQHTTAIRSKLAERYSTKTVNKMLSALRGTLKAAWRLSQMTAEDYRRAADVESVRGETLPAGRALTAGEIAALLDACADDPTPAGARDGALIALLRAGGLRRAEVCALTLADYNAEAGTLRVCGKGNKERELPIVNGAADALADWLAVRGTEAGPIFTPIGKGGAVTIRRMYPEAVFNMLRKRAKQAGISGLSPHDFRRTFASDLMDAGADISTVQRLMGHASVATTTRYDRRGEAAKRKAVELLHVPYRKRI